MQRDRSWIVLLLAVVGIVVFVGLPLTTGLSARLTGSDERAAAGQRSGEHQKQRDKAREKVREKTSDKARDKSKRAEDRRADRRQERRREAMRWFGGDHQGQRWLLRPRMRDTQRAPWWMMGPFTKPDGKPYTPGGRSPVPAPVTPPSPGSSPSPSASPSASPAPSASASPS